MLELLNPELTDEERDRRALATEDAILENRATQNRLEHEAVNLIGFADYILNHIDESRTKRRWLGADELLAFVRDFLTANYRGTKWEPQAQHSSSVRIQLPVRREIRAFHVHRR